MIARKKINGTDFLNECGLRVVRFTNSEVASSLDGVLLAILEACDSVGPSPRVRGRGSQRIQRASLNNSTVSTSPSRPSPAPLCLTSPPMQRQPDLRRRPTPHARRKAYRHRPGPQPLSARASPRRRPPMHHQRHRRRAVAARRHRPAHRRSSVVHSSAQTPPSQTNPRSPTPPANCSRRSLAKPATRPRRRRRQHAAATARLKLKLSSKLNNQCQHCLRSWIAF